MSRYIVTLSILSLLSACGTTPTERGLTGAGIGAGAGAAASALTGGSVVGGALLGGAAGGATGALTNESNLNLGKPLWQR